MINITAKSNTPLYQQIYEQIKLQITDGVIREGTRLTSSRALAKNLCVARNTVENAYAQLCLEGYVFSKPGSGFIVMDIHRDSLPSLFPNTNKVHQKSAAQSPISSLRPALLGENLTKECLYDFQYGNLNHTSFPSSLWRRLTADALCSFDAKRISCYNDNQGEFELRAEILKYVRESRGVRCSPEQVVLCCGTQYALGMICQLASQNKRQIAVEEPGYDGARIVFKNCGYEIMPVSVGTEGINLAELDRCPAKLAYITPSHQFPTGVVMPIHNRLRLLQWAQKKDALIIEDDYDSEFRYHTRPIPSLQSIDTDGRVIYIGTFSKSLSPGLRLSYIILPKQLVAEYHQLYSGYYCTVPWLQQKIISLYMSRGYWERHIRKVCLQNKKRHDALVQAIAEYLGDNVRIHGSNAGLHLLLEFTNGESQEWLIERAKEFGVQVYPTKPYWQCPEHCDTNFILIGFSLLTEKDIVEGIRILNDAWFGSKELL